MGQKINPIVLRLQNTNRDFDNCWFSDYFYKNLITKDLWVEHYLNHFLRLLKLPNARYSIQHLQKKTTIYEFLHFSKALREWKSKLFGLIKTKNFSKKNRYFFKNYLPKKLKKFQKHDKKIYLKKAKPLVTSLNQISIFRIQKKITSFQNFELWSALIKKISTTKLSRCHLCFPATFPNVDSGPTRNFSQKQEDVKKKSFFLNEIWINNVLYENLRPSFPKLKSKIAVCPKVHFWIQSHPKVHFWKTQERKHSSFGKHRKGFVCNLGLVSLSQKQSPNSNLVFLNNLLIYKILKLKVEPPKMKFLDGDRRLERGEHVQKLPSKIAILERQETPSRNLNNGSYESHGYGLPDNQLVHWNFSPVNSKYRTFLEKSLSWLDQLELDLICFKSPKDWQSASYLADDIVFFLEKRVAFRRLKISILKQLSRTPEIRGVRVTCSGRVGGKSKKAQRAKTESLKYGQTSLHVFSSPIDFSSKTARTSFGSVGVKVWISYNSPC